MTALVAERGFTPLEESLPRLEAAVSPLVGIAVGTLDTVSMTDESALPNCVCELASARRTLGLESVTYGSGAHPDPRAARAAAIGEAIERYAGGFVPFERLRETSVSALGPAAVPASRFGLFADAQYRAPRFPFVPFDDETTTLFVEGRSLPDGSPAWLPAELVFLRRPDVRRAPIAYATSSGLACGPSFDEATLAALLEVVERDAVMLAWKCRLSLPLLDWSTDARLTALERRYFEPSGLRFGVVDASCFLNVPIAIAVLHGPPGSGAALAVGAGAAAAVGDAWLKAVSESFGVYRWLRQQALAGAKAPDVEAIESFDDHMLFYGSEAHAGRAAFLDGSPDRHRTGDVTCLEGTTPREHTAAIMARLAAVGATAYVVDVTSPDVRELGLHVARVVAPELCALDVSHAARFLGGTRLARAAFDAGLRSRPGSPGDLNPDPHPFP